MKEQETLVDPKRIPDATRILTNLAYLMGDVTNTLMMDAEYRVKQLGFNLKHDCKRRLKQAVEDTDRTLQRSHELGYNQGKEKGHDEGYLEGFKEGREIGHNEGYKQGKEEGFADGKRYGASVKYNEEALKEMGVEFGEFNKL